MISNTDPFFLQHLDADGNLMVSSQIRKFEPGALTIEIVSPNLCDQSTWYQQATGFTDVEFTRISDTEFQHPDTDSVLIDPYKVNAQEGRLIERDGSLSWRGKYRITLKENALIDITDDVVDIDFETGIITIDPPRQGTVTVSAHKVSKASRFEFIVQIPQGFTLLDVAYAELQLSLDIDFETSGHGLRFEAVSSGPYPFHALPLELGAFDTAFYQSVAVHPQLGHLGLRRDYWGWADFEAISNVGKNVIPPWGNKTFPTIEFPLNYLAGSGFKASEAVGIRLYTIGKYKHSGVGPLGGNYGSLTLYAKMGQEPT